MSHSVTGTGLLSLIRDFEGRPKADIALAAGYRRDNGKPAFTAFYEAVLKAKGQWPPPPAPPLPPGGIERRCGDGPAIYVACLASYNAGRLFGSWLDLSDGPDADDIRTAIAAVIQESPAPDAEEYAIHDNQLLPTFLARTEWPDIDELAAYCQIVSELDADDATVYRILCSDAGQVLEPDAWRDGFHGLYERPEDFAHDWMEERGLLDQVPDELRCHIDWAGVWRDLDAEGFCATYSPQLGHRYLITSDI
jgi:antirestriction protein